MQGWHRNVRALRVENGEVIATRPVYAGKGMAEVRVKSKVKNVFSPAERFFLLAPQPPRRLLSRRGMYRLRTMILGLLQKR